MVLRSRRFDFTDIAVMFFKELNFSRSSNGWKIMSISKKVPTN
jgi:hypothetical protein